LLEVFTFVHWIQIYLQAKEITFCEALNRLGTSNDLISNWKNELWCWSLGAVTVVWQWVGKLKRWFQAWWICMNIKYASDAGLSHHEEMRHPLREILDKIGVEFSDHF